MISIPGKRGRTCEEFTRREFLRVGGASLLGISLPELLSLEAHAATLHPGPKKTGTARQNR